MVPVWPVVVIACLQCAMVWCGVLAQRSGDKVIEAMDAQVKHLRESLARSEFSRRLLKAHCEWCWALYQAQLHRENPELSYKWVHEVIRLGKQEDEIKKSIPK